MNNDAEFVQFLNKLYNSEPDDKKRALKVAQTPLPPIPPPLTPVPIDSEIVTADRIEEFTRVVPTIEEGLGNWRILKWQKLGEGKLIPSTESGSTSISSLVL